MVVAEYAIVPSCHRVEDHPLHKREIRYARCAELYACRRYLNPGSGLRREPTSRRRLPLLVAGQSKSFRIRLPSDSALRDYGLIWHLKASFGLTMMRPVGLQLSRDSVAATGKSRLHCIGATPHCEVLTGRLTGRLTGYASGIDFGATKHFITVNWKIGLCQPAFQLDPNSMTAHSW